MKKYIELKTPDLGDSDKIELIKWYVSEGEKVEIGQELIELVTDKAAFPVESPYEGILKEIKIGSGSIVQKGEVLGILELKEQ
ncbi:MAG: lipoyl domain-containing protein [Leptospiraceae bacterium]|nr:lipoyl domain-containing protein [Leptospiraceae bacterium]